MPQISKYPISREVYDRVFDIFLKTIVDLQTKNQVIHFFKEFLSPTEQIMLAKRLAIAILLAKDFDYREISKILRVSTSTVRDIALTYKNGDGYKQVVKKLLSDEKIEEFWASVGEKIAALLALPGSKSGTWLYLKQELENRRRNKPF